jgi:hypothetical protein
MNERSFIVKSRMVGEAGEMPAPAGGFGRPLSRRAIRSRIL